MAKSSKKSSSQPKAVAYIREWQRCPSSDLPDLFYAYNTDSVQTERIVTFHLGGKGQAQLLRAARAMKGEFHFVINLGLRPGYQGTYAPEQPHFALIAEVVANKPKKRYQHCAVLKWVPNPKFPGGSEQSADSGVDAIPGASAFLFVHSWLETPYDQLQEPFQAAAYVLDQRVKSFIFQPEESARMLEDLERQDASFYVHLGRGISVSSHPFTFRPVVEITTGKSVALATPDDPGEGDSGSYYDFSRPEPPYSP